MPIFEYRCTNCGNQFEELILNSEKKIYCPYCGNEKIEKLPSLIGGISVKKSGSITSPCSTCSTSNTSMCSSGKCGLQL